MTRKRVVGGSKRRSTPAHIGRNLAALDVELPARVIDRLDAIDDRFRTVDPG